jgi:hypothetical protein
MLLSCVLPKAWEQFASKFQAGYTFLGVFGILLVVLTGAGISVLMRSAWGG